MPELPEVETLSLQIDYFLKGLKITDIEILNRKSFLGRVEDIKGKRIIGAERRAKIIFINLEDGTSLAIHLKLTGQLIYRKQENTKLRDCDEKEGPFAVCKLPNKFTRVIFSFDNGGRLYFNDLRIFGWIKIVKGRESIAGLAKFGPEANDEKTFTLNYFKDILSKTKKPIKLVLLDQEKLAGVGNIYANEALFAAKIMPDRSASSLTEEEAARLRTAIIKVLNEAIKYKGTSDRDEAYRQLSGQKGEYQNYLKIYGKDGQKCPYCSGRIEKTTLGGRGTYFCRRCQK